MPVINRGDDYFAVVTYTGNGTSQTISGLRFQPDFVWIKGRSGATDHALYDAQRGVQKRLESNTTDAEVSSDNGVTAFNSDGFSIGSLAQVNTNGATYVAWCWKEGPTQGFDIVTYTGTGVARTVAHNLGVAPKMVIVKRRDISSNWVVWHGTFTGLQYLNLESTAAVGSLASVWNSTVPTSSVFSLGTDVAVNGNGGNLVAYLFAAVSGYSAFGSYTGNGSADGPMVFTGFQPRFVMMKAVDATNANDWVIIDTTRKTSNNNGVGLRPNLSNAEFDDSGVTTNGINIDVLSNGFKPRGTSTRINGSGSTVIYAAFASSPFKNSLAF
jgi:hypothetical protein